MNQNLLIPILTVLFYVSSILGGNNTPTTEPQSPHIEVENNQVTNFNVIGQQGQTITNNVTVRTGPGTQYNAIASINQGTEVVLLDQKDDWYQIRLKDGITGWTAGYLIDVISPSLQNTKIHKKTILGYYVLGTKSFDSLVENGNSITDVATWSWGLDSYGNLTADFDPAALGEVLNFAGNRQLRTYALIHNMFNGNFDNQVVSNLLNNKYAMERAVEQIYQTVTTWGLKGVNLDLENISPTDTDKLIEFVTALSERLHSGGLELTMAVPAKTDDNDSNSYTSPYNYGKLGEVVDKLIVKAYDQHYQGGPAGPIASVQWVESVINYALSQVPGEKLILGIPNYGYDWPKSGPAQSLTYEQTMQLAATEGANIRWHSKDKVPYFKYGKDREVWFENRYSIKYKLELVKKYNLNGIALWHLGQEDPGIWQTIDDTFK